MRSINDLVSLHVREARLLSSVGAEVSFQLPYDSSSAFQAMLTEIDARKSEFGVSRYGEVIVAYCSYEKKDSYIMCKTILSLGGPLMPR